MTDKSLKIILKLIEGDTFRLKALDCVQKLELPQCYIAAGFVRNLVWDHLHGKATPTPLNDVDVIYFDHNESDKKRNLIYENDLNRLMPEVNWQVRNQAFMHVRNGDQPYTSSLDAMGFWPEKETAVAVRLLDDGQLECVSAFGFESLFQLQLTHNANREYSVFEQRLKQKQWLKHWPLLRIALSY